MQVITTVEMGKLLLSWQSHSYSETTHDGQQAMYDPDVKTVFHARGHTNGLITGTMDEARIVDVPFV